MMKVLFITDNSMFPIYNSGSYFSPVPVVGGFIFLCDQVKMDLCDSFGVEYEVKPIGEIEYLIIDENE